MFAKNASIVDMSSEFPVWISVFNNSEIISFYQTDFFWKFALRTDKLLLEPSQSICVATRSICKVSQ